jgi:hypothetical protein
MTNEASSLKGFLDDAKRNGKIVAGGEVLGGKGYFIQSTIVRIIPDDSRLVLEEQFEPIVPVLRHSDVDDAIARANAKHQVSVPNSVRKGSKRLPRPRSSTWRSSVRALVRRATMQSSHATRCTPSSSDRALLREPWTLSHRDAL